MFFLPGILVSFLSDCTMLPLYLLDGKKRCNGTRLGDLRINAGQVAKLDGIVRGGSRGTTSSSYSKRSIIDYIAGSTLTRKTRDSHYIEGGSMWD